MEFDAILESIINPGPDGPDPAAYDQLRDAHTAAVAATQEEMADINDQLSAALGERDAALASVVEVKAMNFDKLMAAGEPKKEDPDLSTKTLSEDVSEGEMTTEEFFEKETD